MRSIRHPLSTLLLTLGVLSFGMLASQPAVASEISEEAAKTAAYLNVPRPAGPLVSPPTAAESDTRISVQPEVTLLAQPRLSFSANSDGSIRVGHDRGAKAAAPMAIGTHGLNPQMKTLLGQYCPRGIRALELGEQGRLAANVPKP